MALRAVQERSLGDQVFDQLAAEILSERYVAGAALPAERTLAEIFRVNRHVVREALKRLEQLGLISTSRAGGAEVTDFKRRAGLEVLAMMAEHAHGEEVNKYLLSVLEMRALIGADVVRLCAQRASGEVREALVQIAASMRTTDTDAALFDLEVRFWECLLQGADNIAYRLSFNSLLKGAYATGSLAMDLSLSEIRDSDFRGPLSAAIAAGEADEAEAMTKTLMRRAIEALAEAVRTGERMP
ncbi:MAG TPA: GntR family transcriptional regulator [Polyangiaceae bacterium]|jgi:DNA-binding FadR family transcriptional regulator|nr:GntR family transcriptional regulator [Polyangiaceae bacterium]